LAALPIEKVSPTPFQRDVSPAHVKKLTTAIGKTRRFLDPIIAMRDPDGAWRTPNGNHRLTAMRELGAKSIVVLIVPERAIAYQILALNIEKAHNLRERATEVRRMIIDLSGWATGSEKDFELELEEPGLVTLGFAYEAKGRLSGSSYASVLRKVDGWVEGSLADAVQERRKRAAMVVALDEAVDEAVGKLKEAGLTSPYLKSFVVARVNPLRFMKGEPPPMEELLASMAKKARSMDASKIKATDLARSGGTPDESE
jgi:ParB family transcriptional regulator, chromosome partitioning protein